MKVKRHFLVLLGTILPLGAVTFLERVDAAPPGAPDIQRKKRSFEPIPVAPIAPVDLEMDYYEVVPDPNPFQSEYSLNPIPFDPSQTASDDEWIPDPVREFRAAWVVTAQNRDWPSRPGLSVSQMKKEAVAILDRLVELNMNAVIFQVRPHADALYRSEIEPWSFYLTGRQGRAPSSGFDPLAFWVEESHSRGLQLHAWFNPYRAYHGSGQGPMSSRFVAKNRSDLVVKLEENGSWWFKPTTESARQHTLEVITDVVARYDIDGVHLDDHFYPTPRRNDPSAFPDASAYRSYRVSGGGLSIGDWRRDAVDRLMEELYHRVKAKKRHVEIGISPFGFMHGENTIQITGLDSYRAMQVDAGGWLMEGWVDYMMPRLGRGTGEGPSHSVLLDWWHEQNFQDRHLWPGLKLEDTGELVRQIEATRDSVGIRSGTSLFSTKDLMRAKGGHASVLSRDLWSEKAIIPSTPWAGIDAPSPPKLSLIGDSKGRQTARIASQNNDVFQLVINQKRKGKWSRPEILSVTQDIEIDREVEALAVRVVNRLRLMSTPEILELNGESAPGEPVRHSITRTETVDKFSFNTDGSSHGKLSGSHQSRTASGIGNGGEILGYTIPLDSSLRRIKTKNGRPVAKLRQAAILTFTSDGKSYRVLAVGNDTGGRHINGNSRNRGWGELGINTWREVQRLGLGVQISRNRLGVPRGTTLQFAFLDQTVRSVEQYRELKSELASQGMLDTDQPLNVKFEFVDSGKGE